MPFNALAGHRPWSRAYHGRKSYPSLPRALGLQTGYQRVCSATTGQWGAGNPAFALSFRRCGATAYPSSAVPRFPTMRLSPRPFGSRSGGRLGVICSELRPPREAIHSVRDMAHSFPSSSSSISKAVSRTTRQQSCNLLAARYYREVDALAGKVAPVEHVHRHLHHLLYRFFRDSRAETPQGSLPACASGDVATRIRSITDRHSLFPTPLPAPPLGSLTAFLPAKQERYGLTTFRKVDTNGVGALCSPGALAVHDRVMARPGTRSSALLAQAWQHLWLASCYDVYREFTSVHHTIHPAPSPPDAGRYTVPSRFRCQSGDCGYRVRGLCTGGYLPAHPRRILLMEQQVWSIHMPDNQPCDLVSQCHFKKVMHRAWAYFQARLAFTMALFNVLVQWHGFQPHASGFVPLSIAEFSL